MNLQLQDKRALVTGSSSGIGAAIAKALAAEGAAVVVHGRNEGEARRVAREIHAAGGREHVVLGDLASDADAARIAVEATAALTSSSTTPGRSPSAAGGTPRPRSGWNSTTKTWGAWCG